MKTYIISDGRRVKIGRTKNVKARRNVLQIGSAYTLKILVVFDGDFERQLHQQFAASRLHGEWFDLTSDIQKFVAKHTGARWTESFWAWLQRQKDRVDEVGRFALIAASDHRFPRRTQQLHYLLRYYQDRPPLRKLLKRVHAEWRRTRDSIKPNIESAA